MSLEGIWRTKNNTGKNAVERHSVKPIALCIIGLFWHKTSVHARSVSDLFMPDLFYLTDFAFCKLSTQFVFRPPSYGSTPTIFSFSTKKIEICYTKFPDDKHKFASCHTTTNNLCFGLRITVLLHLLCPVRKR